MMNPYITPENYFAPYMEELQKIKESPGNIEFDKLCFHVFSMNEDGKKLIEIFKERYLCAATPAQINENYHFACIYFEGYKSAFRHLIDSVNSYQKRKDYEASQIEKESNESI